MVFLHPDDGSVKQKTSVPLSPEGLDRKRPPGRSKTCTIRLHRRYPASILTGAAARATRRPISNLSILININIDRPAEKAKPRRRKWSGCSGSRPGGGEVFTTMKGRVGASAEARPCAGSAAAQIPWEQFRREKPARRTSSTRKFL